MTQSTDFIQISSVVPVVCVRVCICICVCVCMHVCTCVCTHMCVHMCSCVHVCAYVCLCVCKFYTLLSCVGSYIHYQSQDTEQFHIFFPLTLPPPSLTSGYCNLSSISKTLTFQKRYKKRIILYIIFGN